MKKVKTSAKGRICKYHNCKKILSIYNREAYCYVHLGQIVQEHKQKVSKS